ncbi:MAG: LacI family DNA-binding transcriptional regulator [Bacteroidota bacterium]|jgi:LacI family transcriptional regulator
MKRLQLEDISKQLGYSKTLISMVLNGKGDHYGISKKTQEAVMDAVNQLDYTPNKFARALRTGKSFFIGLIVADISNPFYSLIAKNIESSLFERGYNLMVCSSDENETRERKLVEMMQSQQGVDGLIVASCFKNADFYNQPKINKIPTIFIDRILPLFSAHYVIIDNYGGSIEIVNKLVKSGSKKIACLSITPSYLSTIEDRINGYKEALQKNNLTYDEDMVKAISYDQIESEVKLALNEFITKKKKPDAIYCLNNSIAIAVLKLIKLKEYNEFYKKTQIASFDDVDLFNLIDTPVISVSQPIKEIGSNAGNLVVDLIDGKLNNKTNLVLSTKLIERN